MSESRSGGLLKPQTTPLDGGAFSLRRGRALNVVVTRATLASVPVLEKTLTSTLCVDVEPEHRTCWMT
jgi:hypothetical protein